MLWTLIVIGILAFTLLCLLFMLIGIKKYGDIFTSFLLFIFRTGNSELSLVPCVFFTCLVFERSTKMLMHKPCTNLSFQIKSKKYFQPFILTKKHRFIRSIVKHWAVLLFDLTWMWWLNLVNLTSLLYVCNWVGNQLCSSSTK